MAPRAIWSGNISFGLVSIPVKLFSATRSQDISFNLVHATCGTRIEQKRWCPTDEEEVPWGEIARGYEYAKGKFVVLTDEDFEEVRVKSRHSIDITAFVEAAEIDPVFYEKTYALAPDTRGEKPYALLLKAMSEKELVAIATITIRKKEQLCALRPHDDALVLETLYYQDEVKLDEQEVDLSGAKVSAAEVKMALQLIDMLRKPFDPAEYQDTYREALQKLIDAKLEGREQEAVPVERGADVIDLKEALARSLKRSRGSKAKATPSRKRAGKSSAKGRSRKAG